MASPWLTNVAGGIADYYRSTQPLYNAARNRQRALERQDEIERQLIGELQTLDPNNPDYQGSPDVMEARRILREGLPPPMTSGVKQVEAPELPALQFSDVPKVGVAPQPSSTPMLTVNPLYKREASDLVRELRPPGQGSSAEAKMSVSSSGATAAQQKESYDEYRRTSNELVAKDRELAIKKARLALMQQSAARVKAGMVGTEEADAFDKRIEDLSREVATTEAAREKAGIKKAELDAKIAVSAKAAETQQAKIAVTREAKSLADNWRRENASGKLANDRMKIFMDHLNKSLDRSVRVEGQLVQLATAGLPIVAATGMMPKLMEMLTRGNSISRALNSGGLGTGAAAFDSNPEMLNKAITELVSDFESASQEQAYVAKPEQPKEGWFQDIFGSGEGAAPAAAPAVAANIPSLSALAGRPLDLSFGGGGGSIDRVVESGTGTMPTRQDRPPKLQVKKKESSKAKGPGAKPARTSFSSGKDYIAAVAAWRKAGGKD